MEPNNRKVVWVAVGALIALTAGFAMVSPRKHQAMHASEKPLAVEHSVVTAVAPDVEKPAAALEPKAVAAKPNMEPQSPAPQPEVRKPSCNCETAEADLPDLCPNAACLQCKAKCGIIAH